MTEAAPHISVLLDEVVEALAAGPGDTIIDGITVDADSGDVSFTFYSEDDEDGTTVTMPREIFDELAESVSNQ